MLAKKYFDGVEILSIKKNRLIETLKNNSSKIKKIHPEVRQIILFGSFSRNDYTPYSDVDIAIIIDNTDKNFIQRQDDFIDYFSVLPLDVNLVVYTIHEINKMSKERNSFIKEVLNGFEL